MSFGLGKGLGFGRIQGRTGPHFSPADIFAANDNGAWFDPFASGTLYRTPGLTLQSRYNGPIKGIKDKSGKGNNAAQIVGAEGAIQAGSISAAGSGYTNGTYTNVALTGGTGSGARGTIVVAGNVITSVTITTVGKGYLPGAILSAAVTGGAGFTWTVSQVIFSPRYASDITTGKSCVWFHLGFQTLPISFGSALGSNCTIVFANGSSVEYLEGQNVGSSYSIAKTFFQFLIINRALTSDEKAALTTYFSAFCPKYTPTYTCFADASRPDDSGNGLTLATAKKTLPAAFAVLFTQGDGAALGVMPGNYSGQIIANNSVPGLSGKTQSMHAMGAGVIMDAGEVPNVGTSSAFDAEATGYVLEVWGNGNFTLRNYGNNGFGCAAAGTGRFFDSFVSACSNGETIHAASTIQSERNTYTKCPNGACAHTGDGSHVLARFNAYYGVTGSIAGIGLLGENGTAYDYFGCDFMPDPVSATTAAWGIALVNSTDAGTNTAGTTAATRKVRFCRFGTPNMPPPVSIGLGGIHNTTIEDSYLNGFEFQPAVTSVLNQFTRSYGAFGYRPRRAITSFAQFDNCVLKGGGQSNLGNRLIDASVYSSPNDVFGSGHVKNSIITGCATGVFITVVTGSLAAFNAQFDLENNLYFSNTLNYTVGVTPDGTDVVGQDPLIIDTTSDEQADWHVLPGSPSLGAGIGGSDIGLGLLAA